MSSSPQWNSVGLFQPDEKEEQVAFRMAIELTNIKRILNSTTLVAHIEEVSQYDSFNISKRICSLLANEAMNIGAIFGPQSATTSGIIKSISDKFEIPHIETRWDPFAKNSSMNINLYPEPQRLAQALIDVINDMDWETFTIIYDDEFGLLRLQEVFKYHDGYLKGEGQTPFTLHKLDEGNDYRPLLKQIKVSTETHIVLDCAAEKILSILRQAREVGMLGDYHSYIVTSLDAHTIDFEEIKMGRTNITALRMLNPGLGVVQQVIDEWIFEEQRKNRTPYLVADTLKSHSALMYDAVQLFAKGWAQLGLKEPSRPIECLAKDKPRNKNPNGFQLVSFIKMIQMEGMTGMMGFNELGRRDYFSLEIIELVKTGFKKIGSWDPKHGINYTRTQSEMYSELVQSISNKTFIVTSRLGRPYLDKKEGEGLKGNDRFEGYSLDLIDEVAKELGFTYEFKLVPDNQYGSLNKKTGQWNGLIRELQERRADLAICDLTITFDRRSAVDFTMPFMTLGISILYSKPVKQPPDLFSFLLPFSLDVWIYMATAYLGISLLLYFLARCSPYEWENPHPCNPDPDELELTFNLPNCLWFATGSLMAQGCDLLPKISPYEWNNPHPCNSNPTELENTLTMKNLIWHNCGSIMQQGSDIAPQAVSTRLCAGMWWFFTLIMISSYTANLAAFLTNERMEDTIESVEDLAKQNKIKYGVLNGGSTASFFRDSNVSMYQKMWSAMEAAQPSVFVKSNDEGVERVQKGKRTYAYFMESTSIEYQMERKCDLAQVGTLLDSKGYGIAMPFNSPYRTAISGAVLKMQESGKLQELKNKWWKEMHGGGACDGQDEAPPSNELGLSNVGGVFLVLICGCAVALFVAMLEFLWNVRKVAVQEKISPKEAFMLELKFAIRCHGTSKPVRRPKEPSTKGSFMQLDVFEKKGSM
ncbi:hypothetical protein LSTR_LSTR000883 [Laodelphax striatellus]|uniref:Uncharacterized protein n=1 Tax=Laodelphax striatellus TaxID=195883 RepID=A0A482X154_LAOST|nr:hypothetical protein LSTR_LSTR000883 [Laodelphax striatellus]